MTVYTITELQELLKLNPKQAKALMRTDGFPSIKIGREYRVEEDMLRQWFADNKEFPLDYQVLRRFLWIMNYI